MSATIPAARPATPHLLTEMVRVPMTAEAFLDWDHEHYHGGLAEWVDGEARVYVSVTELHQRVAEVLLTLMRTFVSIQGQGRVIGAASAMRAVPGGSVREPDIMYVTAEHIGRVENELLNGPADLLVEIVSKDSVTRDRREKFDEYQEAGVGEYWIIDPRPRRKRAEFYVLDERRKFRRVDPSPAGVYRSTVIPEFWFNTKWLWAETPDSLAALAQVVGIERLIRALRDRQAPEG